MNRRFVFTSVVSAAVVAAAGVYALKTVDCGRKYYDPYPDEPPFERRGPIERQPEPAAPPEPEDVGVPFDEPASDKTIALSDVETVAVKPLRVVDDPQWNKGSLGKPRELLRAKHLRLSDDTPVTDDRGIVEITDGPGFDAKTLEAVLVDFESGEVARFADAFGSIPGLGIAFGRAKLDGDLPEPVIIHADGLAVPYVPEGSWYRLLDVVVNAGHREIYLFDVNENREKNGPGTKFSHWTDLRSPPPPTSLPFPFQPRDGDETTRRYGEYEHDLDGVARNITASIRNSWGDGCTRAEVLRDGSTRCIRRSDEILGEGWHLTKLDEGWVAYNEERKEVQRLAFANGCGLAESVAAPPRVRFSCEGSSAIWSPDEVWRFEHDALGPRGKVVYEGRHNRQLMWGWRFTDDGKDTFCTTFGWIDMHGPRVWSSERYRPSSVWSSERHALVHPCDNEDLHAVDVEEGTIELLSTAQGCASLSYWEHEGLVHAYNCEAKNQRAKWTELVDFGSRTRWRTTKIRTGSGEDFQRIWIFEEPRRVVWVERRGDADRLLVAALR